jgi:hypothetical protein
LVARRLIFAALRTNQAVLREYGKIDASSSWQSTKRIKFCNKTSGLVGTKGALNKTAKVMPMTDEKDGSAKP